MANRHKTSADLISAGEVYGKWTVLDVRSPSSLCECSCGVKRLIRNSFMLAGRVGGCHKCANNRSRPGRRSFKVSLSKEVYSKLSAVVRNAIKRCTDPAIVTGITTAAEVSKFILSGWKDLSYL